MFSLISPLFLILSPFLLYQSVYLVVEDLQDQFEVLISSNSVDMTMQELNDIENQVSPHLSNWSMLSCRSSIVIYHICFSSLF